MMTTQNLHVAFSVTVPLDQGMLNLVHK